MLFSFLSGFMSCMVLEITAMVVLILMKAPKK